MIGDASTNCGMPVTARSGANSTSIPFEVATVVFHRSGSSSLPRCKTSMKLNDDLSFSRKDMVPARGSRSANRIRLAPMRFHWKARLQAKVVAPQAPLAGMTTIILACAWAAALSATGCKRATFPRAASICSEVTGRRRKSEAPARKHFRMESGSLAANTARTWTPLMRVSSGSNARACSGLDATSRKMSWDGDAPSCWGIVRGAG